MTSKSVVLAMAYGARTGRWSQQQSRSLRPCGKGAQVYMGSWDRMKRAIMLSEIATRVQDGAHTMKRASDRNRLRRLRFGQAVLLGVKFEHDVTLSNAGCWRFRVPSPEVYPWDVSRAYASRHEAVEDALTKMGVYL